MRYVMTWANQGGVPSGVERHCPVLWRELEPRAGQYDWGPVERALGAQDTPCHLQIIISMYGPTGLTDYTPAAHRRSLKLTAANGQTGEIPDYANPGWKTAYQRAVSALAARYRADPRVASYQLALGLNQETQATAITADGTNWHLPARGLLDEEGYYGFIQATTAAAIAAWGDKPVYVPGAPSPGNTWGHKRRDVVQAALRLGARYLCCGLAPDNSNATGLGGHAGRGLTDIIRALPVAGCAFEPLQAPKPAAPGEPLALYWLLLRAAHWGADFVQLQRAWFETGHWAAVKALVPAEGARWLVFRDREYPPQTWTAADGTVFGQSGEEECWGRGLRWIEGGELVADLTRQDWARWTLRAAEPVRLGSALPDGPAQVRATYTDGGTQDLAVAVAGGQFSLPAGATYHRVDVRPAAARRPLPEGEPQATATKVRWWLEEYAREYEAGNLGRAEELLYSLIKLAYRLEAVGE